jgi:hypothetical protein
LDARRWPISSEEKALPKMIPESEYRAAGYEPPFEMLPTLDDVERAEEANGSHEPDAPDGAPK